MESFVIVGKSTHQNINISNAVNNNNFNIIVPIIYIIIIQLRLFIF